MATVPVTTPTVADAIVMMPAPPLASPIKARFPVVPPVDIAAGGGLTTGKPVFG